MPRSDTMPPIRRLIGETPASPHPCGIRPGGEGGTTPALGAPVKAVRHALKDPGVRHGRAAMPATLEWVWRTTDEAPQNGWP